MKKMNRKSRRWLRPNSSWGPQTSVHHNVAIDVYPDFKDKNKRHVDVNGTWGLRDCSQYVSIDMYSSSKREVRLHIKAMLKLRDSIDEVINNLEDAVDIAEGEGLW